MGLLDDAIREHLDLKRRRGADPTEVERAEQEALGPVRRAPHGSDEPHLEFVSEEEHGYEVDGELGDHEHEPHEELDWHDPLAPDANGLATDVHEIHRDDENELPPPPAAAAPPPAVTPPPAAAPPPAAERPGADAVPAAPADEAARSELYDRGDEETVEYDVEEALGAEQERDDVLEETPEFLQDTPDHDRLWFEQKPPRDFDFDG
ncbi:MAG TPA: hypothetical protein VGX45_04490 [Solirubrobacteraceae bacterium]|nr:hypothetical protein [Solirubrobacteraceae bacterium]